MSGTVRTVRPAAAIPLLPAIGTWAVAWAAGNVVLAQLVIVAVDGDIDAGLTIPQLLAVAATGWTVFLTALWWVSRNRGTGDVRRDYRITVAPIDLVGVPLGVVTQLVLVPLLYAPLREYWPDTFSDDRLEKTARELVDSAGGLRVVLLAAIVVVGAPIVEELVYRGLLQRSLIGVLGAVPGLVIASAWFALIHFRPIEYPGLLLAGLVFGGCAAVTGRIGPAILTHAAFNATGLALALVAER